MKRPVDRGFIGPHRCNLESENKPYETKCRQKLHRATQIQLNDPVFSHGQLYVYMSRVSSLTYLFMAKNSEFENVTEMLYLKKFLKY